MSDKTLFFERLGRSLAMLHRQTEKRFGFREDNYIGSTPQINLPNSDSWKNFFVANRLEFQIRLAERNGFREKEITAKFHAVERTIETLIPDDGEPPALLHGDLWIGNVLCLEGDHPAVIDPAVYYGHREADIAMTLLFGGFEDRFLSAYREEFPLNEEWERRMELYKLYHLLNHLNLFGDSYLSQIYSTLQRVLS
jgi:fructosamine-3-kinase